MTKKKVLTVVTTRFPWPLTSGFANKNYWLIKLLAPHFLINLHVITHATISVEDFKMVNNYCEKITVYKPNSCDLIFGVMKSVLLLQPFQLGLFFSRKAKKSISEDLAVSDVALASVIRGAQYLLDSKKPFILDLSDSLGNIYLRSAKKFNLIKKTIYIIEGFLMCRYERKVVNKAHSTFLFNKDELLDWRDYKSVEVISHGIHPGLFNIKETSQLLSDGVVIFGKMDFQPNVHAVKWFVNNVLPLISDDIKLYVIGSNPSSEILKYQANSDRVKVLGFIDNPYPLIKGAIANLCPIQTGGGIQNKVLEGLAIGALNIVSVLAAKPLPELNASGIIVCDTPYDWAKSINEFAAYSENNHHLRNMGTKYAKKHFSWHAYSKSLRVKLEECIIE